MSNIILKEIELPSSFSLLEKDPTKDAYSDFLERFLSLGWEKNEKMKEQFGAFSFHVDMLEQSVRINDQHTYPAQILGSFSLSDTTWCWSYANERSNIPIAMQEDALKIKALGEKYGIRFFETGIFETTKNDILAMSAACTAILERSAYFISANDTLLIVYTVDQLRELEMEDTQERMITSIQRSAQHELVNDKSAFRHYMKSKGYRLEDHSSFCTASKNEAVLTAYFNESDCLEKIL